MKQLLLNEGEEFVLRASLERCFHRDSVEAGVALDILSKLTAAKPMDFIPEAEVIKVSSEVVTDVSRPNSTFTYDEVKGALCVACKLGVPDVWDMALGASGAPVRHHLNGTYVPCTAQAWRRNREVHAKAFSDTDPSSSGGPAASAEGGQ